LNWQIGYTVGQIYWVETGTGIGSALEFGLWPTANWLG